MKLRKFICLILALALAFGLTMSAYAVPQKDTAVYVQHILDYYRCYGTDAWQEIRAWIAALDFVDGKQALAWQNIMDTWRWMEESMEREYDVLPDGLPEDDSLAIVIMGFGLNADGTMREELYDRLQVGLQSAQKYPNAFVICTGGGTAANSDNTEAGEMSKWLTEQGIEPGRVIAETNSYSTIHNALYSYDLILEKYHQIESFAVVTSDYHILRSALYFAAVPEYYGAIKGTKVIPVIATACCAADSMAESRNLMADGLAYMAGVSLDWQNKPALFIA